MLELRRSRDRGYADHGWLKSYFTFSFADYYDPEHVDFGPLTVLNEDVIRPGKGYPGEHRQDVQVLTYLIDGELQHRDSLGNDVVLRAGGLQCLTAGTGVSHTEFNTSAAVAAHLLQIIIKPARDGLTPGYEQRHFSNAAKRGVLRLLASPDGANDSVRIQQDARLYGGLFHEAQQAQIELPQDRRAYLHVVRGSIAINETRLNAGDGVKIRPSGGVTLRHGREADVIFIDLPGGAPPPRRKSTARPVPAGTDSGA